MVREYELMIVLDPNLDDAGIESVTGRVGSVVSQRGGSAEDTSTWGRRRLAYPIGRNRDGVYVLFRLRLTPDSTGEIERALKLNENVMRHLLIRVEGLAPAPAAA